MASAWLGVALNDYERHVELDSVGQAAAIRAALATGIARHQPTSLLYLGCAGGNGLEAASRVPRILGLDLNPNYLALASERFPDADFLTWDLNTGVPQLPPADLIFGALILEYIVSLEQLLQALQAVLSPQGKIVFLLLGVRANAPDILPSPYRAALAPVGAEYRTVSKEVLLAAATQTGWRAVDEQNIELPSGKYFTQLTLEAQTRSGTT